MTSTPPPMQAFLDVVELHATASHIASIQAKLDTLARAKKESWAQLLTATARLYAAGDLPLTDLLALLREMKAFYGSGWSKVWDQHVPVEACRLPHLVERERLVALDRARTVWRGTFPADDHPVPRKGTAVVYVIYDVWAEPMYVGSTEQFVYRMRAHERDKPGIHSWIAYRCTDRKHAYELEDTLLKQYKPYLNKRAAR